MALRNLAVAMVAVATVAAATVAQAHAPLPTRSLRLQLQRGRLQGLLRFHLPAAAARVYSAAPDLAVALLPAALAGLRLEAAGLALPIAVPEAHARALPDGSVEAVFLLDAGAAASPLRLAVEAATPLPVELLAASGVSLHLDDGPGTAVRGGLLLRPRPGLPCVVSLNSAAAPDKRR